MQMLMTYSTQLANISSLATKEWMSDQQFPLWDQLSIYLMINDFSSILVIIIPLSSAANFTTTVASQSSSVDEDCSMWLKAHKRREYIPVKVSVGIVTLI